MAQVVKIIATRSTTDKEAKVIVKNFYAKNDKAKEEDKKIKDILLLPSSETIIDCKIFIFLSSLLSNISSRSLCLHLRWKDRKNNIDFKLLML